MLILTRKAGQSLLIDEHTEIKVLEVRGKTVKLGLSLPANVAVRRPESQVTPAKTAEVKPPPASEEG